MKKYIVLSVNDNVDYLYFTPLTCWAWRKFGWEPIVFFYGDTNKNPTHNLLQLGVSKGMLLLSDLYFIHFIEEYRSDTITQISRLYGSVALDGYVMTGDIDMIPLADYWKPNINNITVYGHDLTGFGHFPICYIGAPTGKWDKFMHIVDDDIKMYFDDVEGYIKRDLDTLPQAKDPDFYKYWFSDQDLITERLKQYGTDKIDFINRGQGAHGYARGRVDRGSGGWVLDQPELIDAHLEQQTWQNSVKVQRLYELLSHVWPGEDFTWFKNYTEEFKKLAV